MFSSPRRPPVVQQELKAKHVIPLKQSVNKTLNHAASCESFSDDIECSWSLLKDIWNANYCKKKMHKAAPGKDLHVQTDIQPLI